MIETTGLSCMFVDVLKALYTCSWNDCSEVCQQYLLQVIRILKFLIKMFILSLWNIS